MLSTGKNNIKHKLTEALSQGCEHVVLYYADAALYTADALQSGYEKYEGVLRKERQEDRLTHIWLWLNESVRIFK